MDKLETASNTSEDCLQSSAASSISGLTGYEDEINEIKNLIKSTNNRTIITPKPSPERRNVDILSYEIRIKNLNSELQNALKLNEKYKNDLFSLERRNGLEYHDKFEKLMRRNAQVETQLQNANLHIENMLRASTSQNGKVQPQFNEKLVLLEKKIYELEIEKNAVIGEAEHWKNYSTTLSEAIETSKIKVNEVSDELTIKQSCINELKNKIAEQHVEIENLSCKNVILENNSLTIDSEIKRFKKSANWYKEQLHTCQNDKNKITEELLALKMLSNKNTLDKDNIVRELHDCQNKFKDLSLLCDQQNDRFNRKVNQLEHNLLDSVDNKDEIVVIKELHNEEIETLINEITNVRKTIAEQTILFEKINKENSQLHSRNAIIQKLLNDKTIQLDLLENSKKDTQIDLQDVTSTLNDTQHNLLEARAEISKLKLSLNETNKEKDLIHLSTLKIRNDFQKFSEIYKKLQDESNTKDKMILELQQGRQEMFMNNNWNVCEIEEFKNREKEYLSKINQITNDRISLNSKLDDTQRSLTNAQNEVIKLQSNNDNLTKTNKDLIDRLNNTNLKLEKLLKIENDCTHKIAFYKSSIDELNCELKHSENYKITFKSVVEVLCQKLFKIIDHNEDDRSIRDIFNNNLNTDSYLMEMLDKIDLYLININNNYKQLQNDFVNLKLVNDRLNEKAVPGGKVVLFRKKLLGRLMEIETRSSILSSKCAASEDLLKKIPMNLNRNGLKFNDEMVKLQTAIKVKDLEYREKQKRYEINNRTLLRKVKEHMRGRNTAEKHSKYLQDLYDTTIDTLNTTKLHLNQKDFEIDEGKNLLEIKCRALENAQNTITNLEKELAINNNENSILRDENEAIKTSFNDIKNKLVLANGKVQEYLMESKAKEQTILTLKTQLIILHNSHEALQKTHTKCEARHNSLLNEMTTTKQQIEYEMNEKSASLDKLNKELIDSKLHHSNNLNEIKNLQMELTEFKECNEFYKKEIEAMNCNILQKDEEISSLLSQKAILESDKAQRDEKLLRLLTISREEMAEFKENYDLIFREKYFLQRLNSDLKIALNSAVKENQEIKQNFSKQLNEMEYHSLPDFFMNLPQPSKIDEIKINNLLQRTNQLSENRPFGFLQDSLKSLKREMASLQQQIAEKKSVASSL